MTECRTAPTHQGAQHRPAMERGLREHPAKQLGWHISTTTGGELRPLQLGVGRRPSSYRAGGTCHKDEGRWLGEPCPHRED